MAKRSLQDAFTSHAAAKPTVPAPAPQSEVHARRPPSRRGLKALTVWVDPAVHQQVRMMALEQNRSAEDMMREAVADLFQKYGRPRLLEIRRPPEPHG